MARWMINCEEYTTLVSNQMDRKLSLGDKLAMQLHQWVCPPCRFIRQQFSAMRHACRWVPEDPHGDTLHCEKLPEEISGRIKSAIKDLPEHGS